jgi:hypothetical protein
VDKKILASGSKNPSKNLFTQRAFAWYSRPAKLKDRENRISILVLINLRAFQARQEAVMRESPIELSRVELSVGDSVRMDDQILTVLEISEDEVTFRIDAVEESDLDELDLDNFDATHAVCLDAEGKRLPPR